MLTVLQVAVAAQLILVADRVPQLKYEPSCRAAVQADRTTGSRNENACLQDEKGAKAKLQQEWTQFSPEQKGHCLRLQNAGGMPSYVELLTCVEMGKAAKDLTQRTAGKQNRSGTETTGQNPVETAPPR